MKPLAVAATAAALLAACAVNEIATEGPCTFREVRLGKTVLWNEILCKEAEK